MTIKMTVKEFQDSGLFCTAKRIPFIDGMIMAIDKEIKWETRRPMKYKSSGKRAKCLYGDAGTLLLITGSHVFLDQNRKVVTELHNENSDGTGLTTLYRADWPQKEWTQQPRIIRSNWRNAMFMPKWAPTKYLISRIVEPVILTDLTEEQAKAEGVEELPRGEGQSPVFSFYGSGKTFPTAVEAFEYGWDSIHGARGLYFRTGPEVWRIVFERLVVSD